jgi:hypothetical protein
MTCWFSNEIVLYYGLLIGSGLTWYLELQLVGLKTKQEA